MANLKVDRAYIIYGKYNIRAHYQAVPIRNQTSEVVYAYSMVNIRAPTSNSDFSLITA